MNAITSDEEHKVAMARLNEIFGAQEGPELVELEELVEVIHAYESIRYPIDKPKRHEMLKFQMDRLSLVQADIVAQIGSEELTQAVLEGTEPLTDEMIERLHSAHGVSNQSFLY
jgi:antitoxin component HigA of HigAB toxin-antitoxin module